MSAAPNPRRMKFASAGGVSIRCHWSGVQRTSLARYPLIRQKAACSSDLGSSQIRSSVRACEYGLRLQRCTHDVIYVLLNGLIKPIPPSVILEYRLYNRTTARLLSQYTLFIAFYGRLYTACCSAFNYIALFDVKASHVAEWRITSSLCRRLMKRLGRWRSDRHRGFDQAVQTGQSTRGFVARGSSWRGVRPAGSQRLGEDDDDSPVAWALETDGRPGDGRGIRLVAEQSRRQADGVLPTGRTEDVWIVNRTGDTPALMRPSGGGRTGPRGGHRRTRHEAES